MTERVSQKNKWIGFVLTLVMAFAMIWMFSSVSHAETAATIKATSAKIRKEPNTQSEQLASLLKDSKIDIISQTTGADGKIWYKIWVDGNSTGYVRSDLVSITDGSTPATSTGNDSGNTTVVGVPSNPGTPEALVPISAKVTGSNNVRVRTSANTSSNNNILTTVTNGYAVTVVARTTGSDGKLWYQVKFTADNKEVIGYIRNDYLELSGECVPLTEETTPSEPEGPSDPAPTDPTPQQPQEPETHKRYETKLISEKWYILDYEVNKQYDIEKLFAAGDENRTLYEKEHSKASALTVWLVIVVILAIASLGALVYLIYRLRECKEAAFIASIENNTASRGRTSDRPRTATRVVHSVGPDASQNSRTEKDEKRPVTVQNGQRPAGPQGGQRPAAPQGGQRPAAPQDGQRPAMPQGSQRPAVDSGRKSKNFMQDEDEFEFEFLNWDGDEE